MLCRNGRNQSCNQLQMEKIMRQLDRDFTLHQAESKVANVQVGDYTYTADVIPELIAYLPTDIIIIGKFCSLANGAILFGG